MIFAGYENRLALHVAAGIKKRSLESAPAMSSPMAISMWQPQLVRRSTAVVPAAHRSSNQ
jgi:hypothetical protein